MATLLQTQGNYFQRYFSKKNWSWKQNQKRLVTLLMIGVAIIMLFPLYMILNNSFKTLRAFLTNPLAFPHPISMINFKFILSKVNYFRLLLNNVIVIGVSLVFIVLFGAMAGYTIARRPSKLKKILYIYIILGITLPAYTMLLPQVKLISNLNLMNNYLGLILLYIAGGMPMSIFLFNGAFCGSAYNELEDAAKIEGSSYFRTFFQIFFPLAIATGATLILLQSISMWNDTTMPVMILKQADMRTLLPELQTFYGRMIGQGTRWERIYAFSLLCMLPMVAVFFLANKFLISGVADGALKG